ncbi:hypothetical protein H0H93_008657 [Arthromyces matolae]|nr:hypothetical protein H0H93_008657 [Arthromyces matolae]
MAGLAAAAPVFKSKFNEFNSFRRPENIQPVTSDATNSQEDAYFCFYPVIKRPNELFTIYNKREQAVTDFANPEDGVCIGFYYNSKREESFAYTSGPIPSKHE